MPTKDQIDQYIRENLSEIEKHFPVEMEDMQEPYERYELLRGYAVACITIKGVLKQRWGDYANVLKNTHKLGYVLAMRDILDVAVALGISLNDLEARLEAEGK